MLAQKLLSGGVETLYVDDCFACHTYTGTNAPQALVTGQDLLAHGGVAHFKSRGDAHVHVLVHSARGLDKTLGTDSPSGQGTSPAGTDVTSFNSNGLSLGTGNNFSVNVDASIVAWVLRNAPNFYGHQVVVKSSGSNATVSFPEHTAGLGMVRVKRTDSTGSWYVWHRSLSAGQLLIGETTAAAATLGHITVSGTTVTLVNGVIADGTYLVEAFAHDTSTDGIIQCGSFTTDGSGNATVSLGWEPQYVVTKFSSTTGGWDIKDTMRGLPTDSSGVSPNLRANLSDAEATAAIGRGINATGFTISNTTASQTGIYLAIRRPNKPPTSGTQVYNAIATSAASGVLSGAGFPPDMIHYTSRSSAIEHGFCDRLRGKSNFIYSNATSAEFTDSRLADLTMDGVVEGGYYSGYSRIAHFFRRAVGCFDQVCYTGTGSNLSITHGLQTIPQLIIVKARSGTSNWTVQPLSDGTQRLRLNTDAAQAGDSGPWNNTTPTSTTFTVGVDSNTNTNGITYVAYLFATKAGISCVTNYTGNGGAADSAGSSQTINCGFTTGSRFVMIKCTSHTSNWIIVDTVRGLVAGNDPTISLNTTAAEVTGQDLLDPDASGFVVNQLGSGAGTSANFNVTGRTYLVLSFA